MKKTYFLGMTFAVAYAMVFSFGMECLLNLLGVFFSISLDGGSVTEQYPRFIPFCFFFGFFALVMLALLFFINLKAAEHVGFSKTLWRVELILAFILSIPMLKPWEMLFDFLQNAF